MEFVIPNLSQIYFCVPKALELTFKTSFWVQNHLLNFCCRLWIHKVYFVVKKLVWNDRIKAFWYTNFLTCILKRFLIQIQIYIRFGAAVNLYNSLLTTFLPQMWIEAQSHTKSVNIYLNLFLCWYALASTRPSFPGTFLAFISNWDVPVTGVLTGGFLFMICWRIRSSPEVKTCWALNKLI